MFFLKRQQAIYFWAVLIFLLMIAVFFALSVGGSGFEVATIDYDMDWGPVLNPFPW